MDSIEIDYITIGLIWMWIMSGGWLWIWTSVFFCWKGNRYQNLTLRLWPMFLLKYKEFYRLNQAVFFLNIWKWCMQIHKSLTHIFECSVMI
jgi:hypothetical protein